MRLRHLLSGERAGIPGELVRFVIVGSAGFIADASVLTFLVRVAQWGPYESRPLSFLVGISLTWLLNRLFTFASRAGPDRRREYARYLAVEGSGALINFGVYAAVLAAVPTLAAYPVVALAAGSGTAMWFNFFGVRWLAFDRGGRARGPATRAILPSAAAAAPTSEPGR